MQHYRRYIELAEYGIKQMAKLLLGVLAACASIGAFAQSNRIDIIRHDAPELAHFGEHRIGVRTL